MIVNQDRFNHAITLFDDLNSKDPNLEIFDGKKRPKELLYAERISAMLHKYVLNPSEALQLAARCQHIQRWKIKRDKFPMTKSGYYQWRKNLKIFHANTANAILRKVGYEEDVINHVLHLVKKERLKSDIETQTMEDVIVLVFIESYLEEFIRNHRNFDESKIMDIVFKSLHKMTAKGRQAVLTMIKIPPSVFPIIKKLY
jgi:hypothetical protein